MTDSKIRVLVVGAGNMGRSMPSPTLPFQSLSYCGLCRPARSNDD